MNYLEMQLIVRRLASNDASLTSLDLIDKLIGDDGATALAQALQVNTTLTVIALENNNNNNIGDVGATALAQALQVNTTLIAIFLENKNISDSGATAFARALQVNTSLQKLSMRNNKIGDNGATALAQALKINTTLSVINLVGNSISDEGANRLWDTLKLHNGTLIEVSLFGDTNDIQGYINFLVNANKNGARNPPPSPRRSSEFFVEALQSLKTDDWEVSIMLQLEATLQFMSDFFQLSSLYTTVSANYKLSVIDVDERNRLVYQALEKARKWCISAHFFAVYQVFLDKANSDEMIGAYEKNAFESLASDTQIENSAFIKKMKQDIKYNAARTSNMERGIKNVGKEFQRLRSTVQKLNRNVQQLKYETDMMGEEVEFVNTNLIKMKKAMVRKNQLESGVAFVSIITNAVTLGTAGPFLQGLANLKVGEALESIVDFSDLEHVRKVMKSSTIETIETFTITDVIEWGLETAGERINTRFEDAIETQDSAFIITAAVTMLALGYETVSEDAILPSQGVDFSMPGEGVDHTKDQTEELPFNANEINVEASDAIFPENEHCFDAHQLDPENKTKVFEASMDRIDLESKQLAVFDAILYGHIEDLKHELSEDNVDFKALDSRKRTCVDFAAVMGRLDMVALIGEEGGKFEVFGHSVMMALARKRDAKLNKE